MTLEEYAEQEKIYIVVLEDEEIIIPSKRWDEVKNQEV